MSREDGGLAFPVADYDHMIFQPATVADTKRDLSGMSLRDYFAAKAMQGICSHADTWGLISNEKIATASYELADAMLAARSA